jgi:hypothetical protein
MMRTSLKFLLLALATGLQAPLALATSTAAPTAPTAHAATAQPGTNTTGGAIPQKLKVAEDKDWKNDAIIHPDDPGTNCVSNITPEDERAARYGNVKLQKSCLPQADAFTRAGEAASYLAHYYQRYTPYANEMRIKEQKGELKDYQATIRNCVTGQGSCSKADQAETLKAMVQYNFGKELRAQVLEGRTRAELMKSVDLGAKGWRELGAREREPKILTRFNALKTSSLRKNTFRLDPNKLLVVDVDKLSAAEQQRLGADYLNHFNEFFDAYSKTTGTNKRWHYVSAKSSALGAENVFRAEWNERNLDQKLGKTLINENRHFGDQRSQNTEKVNEIVKSFKDDMRKETVLRDIPNASDPTKIDKDQAVKPMAVAVNDVGLGLASDIDPNTGEVMKPKDVAAALVVTINKAIHETEEGGNKQLESRRVPSSFGSANVPATKVLPTVSVDVEKFDKFLDAIWPADIAKP